MSETGSGAAEPAERVYFSTIEAEFIRRRGTPFLLSPKDYALARRWHALGIPVDDVCVGIGDAFDRRGERGAVGRVNSLNYCEGSVLEAWERRASARVGKAGAPSESENIPARLMEIQNALGSVDPRFGGAVALAIRSLLRLRVSGKTGEEMERSLVRLEKRLLGQVEEMLSEGERGAIAAQVDRRLGPDASGMEDSALRRTREVLIRQRLRATYRIPRLSLLS